MRRWFVPPARGRKSWSEPPFWLYDQLRLPFLSGTLPDREKIENDFEGYIQGAYKSDGIVYACIRGRQAVFSQARYRWHEWNDGRPGKLFGSPELTLIEKPWLNGTTVDLGSLMEVDVSLAGNFYATTGDDAGNLGRMATGTGRRVVHLRPDWISLIFGSKSGNPFAADTKVLAYLYEPRPAGAPAVEGNQQVLLMPDEVCHYAPYPDPAARFRGMSWLTPVIREIAADKSATLHKAKFFENGATLQTIVKFDKDVSGDAFDEFVTKFRESHEGAENAYKTLALSPGADVTIVGADMKQLDFANVQGKGETRIAGAAGIHPVIVGLSEGLQGSSLNAGNFGAAKRLFVETTCEHLWLSAAPSLQTLLTPPNSQAQLRHDIRDVPFVRQDAKDLAEIQALQAQVLRQVADGGWEPDAAVRWLMSADLSELLKSHTGLLSVQLQEPGATSQTGTPALPPGQGA